MEEQEEPELEAVVMAELKRYILTFTKPPTRMENGYIM